MNLTPQQKAQVDVLDHYFEDYGPIPEVLQIDTGVVQNNTPKFIKDHLKMLNEGGLSPVIIETRIAYLIAVQRALEALKKNAVAPAGE